MVKSEVATDYTDYTDGPAENVRVIRVIRGSPRSLCNVGKNEND